MNENEQLSGALECAAAGFAVTPLRRGTKEPFLNGWNSVANAKSEFAIRQWADIYEGCNFGIVTGPPSENLVVIDVEAPEGHPKEGNGREWLTEWENEHGSLPETWITETGGGGKHIYFRDPLHTWPRVENTSLGIEIRMVDGNGRGLCVACPGTIHPKTGKRYYVDVGFGDETPLYTESESNSLFTQLIQDIIEDEETRNRESAGSQSQEKGFQEPETIEEGERHTKLISLVGSLRAKGLSDDAIQSAVRAENAAKCKPPLTDKELEKEIFPALKRYWKAERPYYKTTVEDGVIKPIEAFKPIVAISAKELETLDIPPVEWIIKGLLPTGLCMISAPPKYYKSFMALDLCISVATGTPFLNAKTEKAGSLYFDLESTKRRPRSRMREILKSKDLPWPDNLYLITGDDEPGRIGEGFERQVEYQLKEHPDIKLVVIDVFQLVRPAARRNANAYERDYSDLRELKKMSDQFGICVLVIHHNRKMKDSEDPFNEISGSTGILGTMDASWMISKEKRADNDATLYITGRDVAPQEFRIRFDTETLTWKYLGLAEDIMLQKRIDEYTESPIRNTIVKLVEQGGGNWEGTVSEIISSGKYFQQPIYSDPRKTGSWVRNFENELFTVDSLRIERERGKQSRKLHIFDINSDPEANG